jgi:hypothetical protein
MVADQGQQKTIDRIYELTGNINRSAEAVREAEVLSLRFAIHWMTEHGYTVVPVQDDSKTISYARLDIEDEDLDQAIAWLPRDVFENSTPGGGWNPVVTLEGLRKHPLNH